MRLEGREELRPRRLRKGAQAGAKRTVWTEWLEGWGVESRAMPSAMDAWVYMTTRDSMPTQLCPQLTITLCKPIPHLSFPNSKFREVAQLIS